MTLTQLPKRGRKPLADPCRKTLRDRERIARLVAAGCCVRCRRKRRKKTAGSTLRLCRKCNAVVRERQRSWQRVLLDSGICMQCNKRAANGSGLCDPCYVAWRPVKYAWLARRGRPVRRPGSGNGWRVAPIGEPAQAGVQRG